MLEIFYRVCEHVKPYICTRNYNNRKHVLVTHYEHSGYQFAGRLLPYYGSHPRVTELIDGIEGEGRHCSALVSPHPTLATPGGTLRHSITRHSQPVTACVWTYREYWLISLSDRLVVVDMNKLGVLVDARPVSVPEGDAFGHITCTRQNM